MSFAFESWGPPADMPADAGEAFRFESWGAPPPPGGVAGAQGASASVVSPMQQMLSDFRNQGLAASQGTTPQVGAHEKSLISDQVYQSDAGDMLFRDPRTGDVMPTDENAHISLRDPADGRLKVYARSPETDEGRIASLGRIAMTGIAAGAPTARPGLVASGSRAPTVEALKDAGRAGYKSPEITGLEVKAGAQANSAQKIMSDLNTSGFFDVSAPQTFGILNKASQAPEGAFVTGQNIMSLYQALGKLRKATDSTEREAARVAQDSLKDVFRNIRSADVIRGDPSKAASTFETANQNWGAAARGEGLNAKVYKAELRAAAANSGQNYSNTIRQRVTDILADPKQRMGYSKPELDMMERIVRGTAPQNMLRFVGNLLGGGGGLGMAVSAGIGGAATASYGGIGAVAPIIGYGIKKMGNALAGRDVDKLSELIRSRSPLGQRVKGPVEEWSKAASVAEQAPTPRNIATLSLASRNLSNNLRDAGISVAPNDLLRSIQGTVQGRPDDE